jgi:anti-sigma factor RsiW
MFTCPEARQLLPRYVRGALPADGFVEVRYHVEGCAGCAEEVRQARCALRLARSGCASVNDPRVEDVPESLLSDIVLVSHFNAAAK